MISVGDGDPPLPLPVGPSGSVSVSRSTSESGFVTIIRLVVIAPFAATRESDEDKVERATNGLVGAIVVVAALTTESSRCGLGRVENEEDDLWGETKTVYRRLTRICTGGEGWGLGIGVK